MGKGGKAAGGAAAVSRKDGKKKKKSKPLDTSSGAGADDRFDHIGKDRRFK